jgi:hypothetical protein
VTTQRYRDRDWTLRSGYRQARRGFKGYVYWNPDWVAMNLDGVGSRLVWSGYRLTERGIRRQLARRLRSVRRSEERRDNFVVRGRRKAAA